MSQECRCLLVDYSCVTGNGNDLNDESQDDINILKDSTKKVELWVGRWVRKRWPLESSFLYISYFLLERGKSDPLNTRDRKLRHISEEVRPSRFISSDRLKELSLSCYFVGRKLAELKHGDIFISTSLRRTGTAALDRAQLTTTLVII